MKRLHIVLLGLGAVFLVYLVWKIGPAELWRELVALRWGLIPLVLSEGVGEVFGTAAWRRCLSAAYRSLPGLMLFRIRMAGYAVSYLTPTATVGGEVAKVALLSSHHKSIEAVSGVLIDKVCFAFAHLLIVMVGSVVVLWQTKVSTALCVSMLLSSGVMAGGIGAFLLLQKQGKLGALLRWLVARKLGGRWLQTMAGEFTEVDEALKLFYRTRPRDLWFSGGWHLLGLSVGVFQTWLFFHLLHQDASLLAAASTWFLSMWFDLLTFAVPANLGTLEASRVIALRATGHGALMGLTYGVMIRLAQLFWAGFGLVNHGLLASRTAEPLVPAAGLTEDPDAVN